MAKPQPKPHNNSTHARLIISDWQVLRQVILYYSRRLRESNPTRSQYEANIPMIDDRQLEDAKLGPASVFLKQLLQAYAKLSTARFEVTIREDITFIEENNQKTSTEAKKSSPREKLLKELKMNDVRKIQQELDKLTEQGFQQWQNAAKHWSNNIYQQLQQVGFNLTETELSELVDSEPKSEIYGRYKDINLTPPKTKSQSENFSDYLYVKSYLLIHSHLSLQQEAHQADDILKVLKPIQKYFEQIRKEEKFLTANQQKQFAEIIRPIEII